LYCLFCHLDQQLYWICNFAYIRLPEDDVNASKHVAVLYDTDIIVYHCYCASVGINHELYKMQGTYIKIVDDQQT
jgi:hypothetical protein